MIEARDLPSTDRLNNIRFEGIPDDKLIEHANVTLYATCMYVTVLKGLYVVKLKGLYHDEWYGKWKIIFKASSQSAALRFFSNMLIGISKMYEDFFSYRIS